MIGYTFHGGDLFHIGHLHQLRESKKHCDKLIVGVLTDEALASYKRYPVIPFIYRVEIYRAIRYVDGVIAQDSRDPTENLKLIRPDVLFHGDDWPDIPGKEWIEANGGKLVVTPYWSGELSTTHIIKKIRDRDDI